MADEDRKPPFDDFDARLKRASGRPQGPVRRDARLGAGWQAGIEVVAGCVGGALLGYGLDRWLNTSPFAFIALFFLGAVAGLFNALRTLQRMGRTEPPSDGPDRT